MPMGVVLQILGFIALAAWSGLVFGPASALLVAAIAFFIIGVAVSDVKMPRIKLWHRKPGTEAP
jgi:uncharacterized membrane protein